MDDCHKILLRSTPKGFSSVNTTSWKPSSGNLNTHDGVFAQDPNDLVLRVGEEIGPSECGGTTLDAILELVPLPRPARDRIDMKDKIFPPRLVLTV